MNTTARNHFNAKIHVFYRNSVLDLKTRFFQYVLHCIDTQKKYCNFYFLTLNLA
jgi:hypothetical protein